MTSPALPEAPWPAPTAPPCGIDATVVVPGSKSLTNRYLVLAALADGPGTVRGALRSRDGELMVAALRALGTSLEPGRTDDVWHVVPAGRLTGDVDVFAGLAGTVMRFLPPLAALADGPVRLDGDEGARVRPMAPVVDALRALGVRVDDDGRGTLPFVLHGRGPDGVDGGVVEVDASGSSQFVSGLLLSGARYRKGLEVRHVGATLPSLPHIDMTVAVLREAGVSVTQPEPAVWRVAPGPVAARDVQVEPDLSNAGAFLAAAVAGGGTVRVPGWPARTTQPGALMPGILEQMGAATRLEDGVLTVTGDGTVRGIDLDLTEAGELAPQVAALMALADGPSRLRGIAHLRGHETDRLAALTAEINRLGGDATETDDGLVIRPRQLHGGVWRTYHDHRMAHAGAIVGLRTPGVEIEDVATTSKTLPRFTAMWTKMLGSSGGTARRQDAV